MKNNIFVSVRKEEPNNPLFRKHLIVTKHLNIFAFTRSAFNNFFILFFLLFCLDFFYFYIYAIPEDLQQICKYFIFLISLAFGIPPCCFFKLYNHRHLSHTSLFAVWFLWGIFSRFFCEQEKC